MDFKMAMETVKSKWHLATKDRNYRDFAAMSAYYLQLPNDLKRETR